MNTRAFITGVSGPELNAAEREFIRSERPWGFILFKRNIETPAQVSLLVRELREWINDPEAPVLVDQEGGRVQRFGPPHWPIYPPGAAFGTLYNIDPSLGLSAARLSARLIAADLTETGVTVDCLPLADVPVPGADAVIGNRAYGTEPQKVAAIARAVTEGLQQGGILPVLKHIPGHGRATADTHFRLPEVETPRAELERADLAAFQHLADLRMSIAGRTRAIVGAGCDMVLHCNGKLDEMREVARETPELSGKALERARLALASRKAPQPFDRLKARAELDALVARAGTVGA